MGIPKQDIEFFEHQSSSILLKHVIPYWAKTTDLKLPVFRYCSSTEYRMVEGNFESKSVSIGDRFKVSVRFCPVVRIDKSIVVIFEIPKTTVLKTNENDTTSIVTGISAWLKIQSAKMAIEPKDRLILEVTALFECTGLHPRNIYKIVEQPVCMQFKF